MERAGSGEGSATDLVDMMSRSVTGDYAGRSSMSATGDSGAGTSESNQRPHLSSKSASQAFNGSHGLFAPVHTTSPQLPSRQGSLARPSPEAQSLQGFESDPTQGQLHTRVSKMRAAEAELRRSFNLSEEECVLDDFMCALQKRLLYQGRMFVFEHHVCFHSNLFGHKKDKVIPLQLVTKVRKRKNLGFPNSIEVTWGDGRVEFFTSFVSREEAYKLILGAWSQAAPDRAAAQMFSHANRNSVKHTSSCTAADLTSALAAERDADASSEASFATEGGGNHHDSRTKKFLSRSVQAMVRPVRRYASERPLRTPAEGDTSVAPSERTSYEGEDVAGGADSRRAADGRLGGTFTPPAERSSSWEYSEDGEGESSGDHGARAGDTDEEGEGPCGRSGEIHDYWAPNSCDPPPLPDKMKPLVKGQLRGVEMAEMCELLFSDTSKFLAEFHASRGDEEASQTPWSQLPQLGRVRELKFITAIKSKFGPPKAMCYQTQRYAMYAGHHLVFETDQTMPDIPYGDCFQVRARWDIHPSSETGPDGAPMLELQSHIMAEFSKKILVRSVIESGVFSSCKEAHEQWLVAAQRVIDERCSSARQANLRTSSASGANSSFTAGKLMRHSVNGVDSRQVTPRKPADEVAGALGPAAGSPAHIALLAQQVPAEHRAAVGQLLHATSGVGSATSEPRQPGLSARQWVLALFGVAFIALQLLILWHLTALPPPAVAPVAAAAVKLAASAHAGAKQPVRAQRAATSAASQQRHLECPGALSAATSLAHLQHQLNLLSSQVAAMVADAGPGSSPEASDSSSHAEL